MATMTKTKEEQEAEGLRTGKPTSPNSPTGRAIASARSRLKDLDTPTAPTTEETVIGRAKERMKPAANEAADRGYVAGTGPAPANASPVLHAARRLRDDNDYTAAGTADINNRIAQVQSGQAAQPPQYGGYLQGRGVTPEQINTVRRLNGQPVASTAPVPVGDNPMDPAAAQKILAQREGRAPGGAVLAPMAPLGPAVGDNPTIDAMRRLERDSAVQREGQLEDIRRGVQDQRLTEALMGRGRGIAERADASRERKDDRIATRGLDPGARAAVLLDREGMREQSAMQRAAMRDSQAQQAAAAGAEDKKRQQQVEDRDAEFRNQRDLAMIESDRTRTEQATKGAGDYVAKSMKDVDAEIKQAIGQLGVGQELPEDHPLYRRREELADIDNLVRQGRVFWGTEQDMKRQGLFDLPPGSDYVLIENGKPVFRHIPTDEELASRTAG